MKKPVRKRKGYDSGGIVSTAKALYDKIEPRRDAESKAIMYGDKAVDRGMVGDFAGASSAGLSSRIAEDQMLPKERRKLLQPEGAPLPGGQWASQMTPRPYELGQAKGGKVKKVLPAKRKRR